MITEFAAGITAGAIPQGITVGADGNLWFAERSAAVIGRAAPCTLPAVVRLSTGWNLRNDLTTGEPTNTFSYGTRPLVPLMGDWDGNGTKTVGTYEGGFLKLRNSNSSGASETPILFGDPKGFAVAGDFDRDLKDDVAVFRNGTWQVRLATGATSTFTFGTGVWPTTVPVVGDWDGDGRDGIGTFTPATGTWNLRNTATAGAPDVGSFVFSPVLNAYPVTGDWNADGIDTVGVKAGTTWHLRNTNDAGAANTTFTYGLANDLPMTYRDGRAP